MRPTATFENELALTPREAFLGRLGGRRRRRRRRAVSCETVAGYPPGIPALLPGERISAATVGYLREIVASGARLHGASDPSFASVTVLRG